MQRFCGSKCQGIYSSTDKDRYIAMKKTKLEKYGDENYVNPEKCKQTCLEKYGVDNASKAEFVINKIKQTNLEKYGVEWSWMNEGVKDKIKQTNIEKCRHCIYEPACDRSLL